MWKLQTTWSRNFHLGREGKKDRVTTIKSAYNQLVIDQKLTEIINFEKM